MATVTVGPGLVTRLGPSDSEAGSQLVRLPSVGCLASPGPGTLAHKWHSGPPESQSPGRLYVPTSARNHQSQDHVHHDPRKQPSRPIAGGCGHGPNKRAVTRSAGEQRTRRRKQRMSDILRFVQDLALGGTSGVIAKTACAPLERIKIILQVQSANTSGVKVGDRTDRIEATDLLPALC